MTIEQKYSIDYKGLTVGKHLFTFEITDDLLTMWDESEVKKGRLVANIEYHHYSTADLRVQIRGTVEIECDRCLEMMTMPIKYDGNLVVKISEEHGEDDGEIMWVHPTESRISLAQYLYESIVLSLPTMRMHPSPEQCNPDMVSHIIFEEPDTDDDDDMTSDSY